MDALGLPNVAHVKTRDSANNLDSSQQVAPHKHLSTCAFSTGNGSNALTPIKKSPPPHGAQPLGKITVKPIEQTCNEMIAKAAELASTPNTGTARGMGFESVSDTERQLTQDLLLSEQQLKDKIATLAINNTPSTSGSYLELKQLSHFVRQALINPNSLTRTSDKNAQLKAP
ncbi:hypothetical protein [Pseudomonas sp. TH31]|uniref:hypothetical protein n=1 Tax=Pseudomonas sp. TH31 TaxID=2796396 RepID=UPI0019132E65|nr:hypothetical protein [Pseudomonas sp. TH31]MBK5418395.1 hypothetical protein [Pseudomonas sp. TH31]